MQDHHQHHARFVTGKIYSSCNGLTAELNTEDIAEQRAKVSAHYVGKRISYCKNFLHHWSLHQARYRQNNPTEKYSERDPFTHPAINFYYYYFLLFLDCRKSQKNLKKIKIETQAFLKSSYKQLWKESHTKKPSGTQKDQWLPKI